MASDQKELDAKLGAAVRAALPFIPERLDLSANAMEHGANFISGFEYPEEGPEDVLRAIAKRLREEKAEVDDGE